MQLLLAPKPLKMQFIVSDNSPMTTPAIAVLVLLHMGLFADIDRSPKVHWRK